MRATIVLCIVPLVLGAVEPVTNPACSQPNPKVVSNGWWPWSVNSQTQAWCALEKACNRDPSEVDCPPRHTHSECRFIGGLRFKLCELSRNATRI
ncbi:hypothetical protein RJ55_02422 [Drechmeria coniospora]|nr:hypothetical protein RJ55_02422 [Drechmeria coniospora]